MKTLLYLVTLLAAGASLSAGKFDNERPDWAPIEPDVAPDNTGMIRATTPLEMKLKGWAERHHVVSQYSANGLDQTWQVGAVPGNRVGALMASATNTLTEAEQAEVDSLNRQVEIFNLKNEKDLLEKPRRKVSTPLDKKQLPCEPS